MTTAIGVMLPTARGGEGRAASWQALLDRASEAAGAGAHALCLPDHLDFPPGSLNLEGLTTVAALTQRVPKVEVVVLVLSAPLRPPGLVGSIAATLDAVAPGRIRIGVGAGVDQREHEDAGARYGSASERVGVVRETCLALRRRCPPVPVVVAGGGPKMLDIAAELADEWNCGMMQADRRGELLSSLQRACESHGRAVRRSVLVGVLGGAAPTDEGAKRYRLDLALRGTTADGLEEEIAAVAAEGFDAVYLAPRTDLAWENTLEVLSRCAR